MQDFEPDPGFVIVSRESVRKSHGMMAAYQHYQMALQRHGSQPVQKDDAEQMARIRAVEDLQEPTAAPVEEPGEVSDEALPYVQANKLIAGMDQEIANLNISPEEARRKASRALYERPNIYDSVGATASTIRLHGIQLDLGAETRREPGFIGLDVQTYGDYGIALHDLNQGLAPFPDGCARAVRIVNALWHIVGDLGPAALLQEVQRVLCIGGELVYEDSRPLLVDGVKWPFLGLALTSNGQSTYDRYSASRRIRQVFTRVHPRVPAYHGAEPDFSPLGGDIPIDLAMALTAYNAAPAHRAMANLIQKAEHKTVKIAKTEPMKQVVIGVVLSPDEVDSQGDVISAEDIEKAAHGFMGTSRIIGSEHGAPIEAHPVESYIAPQDLHFDGPDGKTTVTKGSWILGVKVLDPEQWSKVMDEGYTGFSVGGFGLRDDM
jgi:SAM-dependent methyltransferase